MPLEPRDEVHRLRNTMRDLMALSTLPAVWAGYAPQGIIASLADVLLSTLSLDLVFVRTGDAEAVRGEGLADDHIRLVAAALAPVARARCATEIADPPARRRGDAGRREPVRAHRKIHCKPWRDLVTNGSDSGLDARGIAA